VRWVRTERLGQLGMLDRRGVQAMSGLRARPVRLAPTAHKAMPEPVALTEQPASSGLPVPRELVALLE